MTVRIILITELGTQKVLSRWLWLLLEYPHYKEANPGMVSQLALTQKLCTLSVTPYHLLMNPHHLERHQDAEVARLFNNQTFKLATQALGLP